MNQHTEILYYLKSIADSDPFINTVTKGDVDEIDLENSNIYPLLHITLGLSGNFTNTQTIVFNVELTCLSQRDISNETEANKFWGNDNEVDNLNETLASLNRIWSKMYIDLEKNNITSSENPEFSQIDMGTANLLDGFKLEFDIEAPNTTINLCE